MTLTNLLHINRFKKHQKPELVFLHGWANDSCVWESTIKNIQEHYSITSVDLPGHGKSKYLPEKSWLQALEGTLTYHRIKRPILVGWSLGGAVALQFCQQHHSQITAFVGIGTSVCFVKKPTWQYGIDIEVLNTFSSQLQNNPKKTITDFFALQFFASRNNQSAIQNYLTHLKNAPYLKNPSGLNAGLTFLKNHDIRHLTPKVPCFYFLGKKDRIVPSSIAYYLQENAIEYACENQWGHIPFMTHSTSFLPQFLKRLNHVL